VVHRPADHEFDATREVLPRFPNHTTPFLPSCHCDRSEESTICQHRSTGRGSLTFIRNDKNSLVPPGHQRIASRIGTDPSRDFPVEYSRLTCNSLAFGYPLEVNGLRSSPSWPLVRECKHLFGSGRRSTTRTCKFHDRAISAQRAVMIAHISTLVHGGRAHAPTNLKKPPVWRRPHDGSRALA